MAPGSEPRPSASDNEAMLLFYQQSGLNEPQSILGPALQCPPSVDVGSHSAFETTWGPAQGGGPAHPRGREKGPPSRTKATPPPDLKLVPADGTGQPEPPPSPGPMAKLTGETRGSLRRSPGLKGRGSPHPVYPLISLLIGISENGFHNSVSSNQLFRTPLPTDSDCHC